MRASVVVLGVLLTAAPAYAHVGVTPRESKPGATETYTLRFPSEGGRATTAVTMEVPDDVTVVSVAPLTSAVASQSPQTAPAQAVADFFARYDRAFVAKDLDRLAAMYHPDVTIFEGGGVNTGWADYRDNHIGPELKSFNDLKFSHSNIKVQMLSPDAAYVTSEYSIEVSGANGPTRSGGLETDVLLRQNGAWVIRHTHTSARRQRPAGQQE
jgi:uncharacterized protein (TIGR02246 family)